MKTGELHPLIGLLAATNELHRPVRDWTGNNRVAAIAERRDEYARRGLPVPRGGGDESSRKNAERRVNKLERSGLVVFSRRAGKRAFWKLTSDADWRLRSLGGLFGFGEMLTVMLALQAHENQPHEANDNMVPETWLAGLDGWGSRAGGMKLATIEEAIAPALCRGLVAAWSDRDGRAIYRLTSEGRAFLDAPEPPPADLPGRSEDAADAYNSALLAQRDLLTNALPSKSGALVIPLSCGCWPPDEIRAPIPFVLTRDGKVRSVANITAAIRKALRKKIQAARRRKKPSTTKRRTRK